MTRTEYEILQEEFSKLADGKRLCSKGITGKRQEGFEEAILQVKSKLKRVYMNLSKERNEE